MTPSTSTPHDSGHRSFDVLIVGAGFAGLYMLHLVRKLGLSARVVEVGKGVGGTWYWNRYPGARCDIESMQYSYSFSDEFQNGWDWSERFAPQPEILRYADHVADRLDLRRDIQFETRVVSARFDETDLRWHVATDRGDRLVARFVVMATGCLSTSRLPHFEGRESFRGNTYHTGHWPHDGVDFTGRRVGVIGTGSSAIQSIPVIADQAAHVTVFQRTPNFSIPAQNAPLTDEERRWWRDRYPALREQARQARSGVIYDFPEKSALEASEAERKREYDARWAKGGINFMQAYNDLILNVDANETAADYVRSKIREIVRDPVVAETLMPRDYPIGTKRICVDTDYYATFNRDTVTLVDIRATPIEAITPEGLRTASASYQFDDIVFATGFDAMTGALLAVDIEGPHGVSLRDTWAEGPRSYLGLMVAGFPNLFTVTGPGSPSVLSNMLVSIEQHVDWIAACIASMRERGLDRIEAEEQAQTDWVAHCSEVAHTTLYPRAASWYMGANIDGKPRVFMPYIGGVGRYREICAEIAQSGYRGFSFATGRDRRVVSEAAE